MTWIWLAAVIIAGIFYFYRNYQSAFDYINKVRIGGLIFSVLLIFLTRALNVDLIRESVREVGWVPPFNEMIALISITQLGKYIPGGVWQFAARFGAYKENQLTPKKMGKAFLIENIWVVLGGVMSGLIFFLLGNPEGILAKFDFVLARYYQFLLALILLLIWFLGLLTVQRIFSKNSVVDIFIHTIRIFFSQITMFFLMGVSYSILFPSLDTSTFLFIVGGYIISYVAGYLAIIAPGGLGVREVVSVALFTGILPFGELTALTLFHRLLYTFVEFALGIYGFLLTKRKNLVKRP